MALPLRKDVPPSQTWNIEDLYPDVKTWEADLASLIPFPQKIPLWPELFALKGTFIQGAPSIKKALDTIFSIDRRLSKLLTYAHLKHDEDVADDLFKKCHATALSFYHQFNEETSWCQPELLALPQTELDALLKDPLLTEYHFYLEQIIRLKPHTLSYAEEKLLALAGQPLQTAYKTFSALDNADFTFGSVKDAKDAERTLTHGSYSLFIRDSDRVLRERAFKQYHAHYLNYQNSLCELLSGQIQNHYFQARARNYNSCLEAALYPKKIDPTIYHSLISTVHHYLPSLHNYMALRKEFLKVDSLHYYDLYVSLLPSLDLHFTYENAEDLVIESVAPLGNEYQTILKQGLKKQRWVDPLENKNKRSGAYSSGCFDSHPYILMNYKGTIRDVFTLAHEAGHSMHSLYSRRHQPYHYSDYSIFLAEIASTFNENLLIHRMLSTSQTREMRAFLINQQLEDLRATLFRQTMFAEFELFLHECVEKGIPLTPAFLNDHYLKLNTAYFGPSVTLDKEIAIEWARIPHFYYNFYVFQYATGISAAHVLSHNVLKGTEKERESYLNFLKGGSSLYPTDLLKRSGIDMKTPHVIATTLEYFSSLTQELRSLLQNSPLP